MNGKLPILSATALLAAALHGAAGLAAGDETSPGRQLIVDAARRLLDESSLEAKVRQRVNMYGHQLVGSGTYMQLGQSPGMLLRLELKLNVADQVTSVQQVCDGRFFWTRRVLPNGSSLRRVDLRRLQRAEQASGGIGQGAATNDWMLFGGLTKLLQSLAENFQFSPPRAGQMGRIPVWVTEGQWKRERLAGMVVEQKDDILAGKPIRWNELPPRLPASVEVTLSRDGSLPLFPFRIEYRRGEDERRGSAASADGGNDQALVALEFFQVRRNPNLDPRIFQYEPGEQEVVDQTEKYLTARGINQ